MRLKSWVWVPWPASGCRQTVSEQQLTNIQKMAWRNLRTQRSLSLFLHWTLIPSYDIASGLCLNTYLSDGECKVRQGSPAHHHITEVFKLKQASLQSASAVLVQPSLTTRRNLTPNSGESFLGLRMAEHILAFQFNMPILSTCALWPSVQPVPYHGILPLPINTLQIVKQTLQNLFLWGLFDKKPHKKSNTTKMASGNCVSADKNRYLIKGTQNTGEVNDQLPGLDSTFLMMRPRPREHFW